MRERAGSAAGLSHLVLSGSVPGTRRGARSSRKAAVALRVLRYTRAGGCSVAPGSPEHVLVVGSGGRARVGLRGGVVFGVLGDVGQDFGRDAHDSEPIGEADPAVEFGDPRGQVVAGV